jgi:TolB protein
MSKTLIARRPFLFSSVAMAAVTAVPARGEIRIDITRGRVQPMPIAISPLFGEGGQEAELGRSIKGVIAANLERSGLFRPLDERAYIQAPNVLRSNQLPRFGDWRVINAQALVHGDVQMQGSNVIVRVRLWDVFGEQEMYSKLYSTPDAANWRRIAHFISDAVYKRITGEDGYFDTRVVYISESGPAQQRIKRLAIMDQDGANHRFLTDGRNLVLTPRFSPAAQDITYLAYVNNRPRVYILNIDSGRQDVLGDYPGMTFAPRFSPDGNRVIMSYSQDGNSNISAVDIRSKREQRLTNHPSINTSPSYSPDGRQIVFNSDRGGTQQLYVMEADGGNPRRISFAKGRYGTPVWSPRGDLIAFTRIDEGKFYIGVMRTDGSGERLLTDGFLVEGPTWAPNGRVLMYFRQGPSDARGQGGNPRLHSIDLTGFNEREIMTPADGSDPAWSPLLP